ncbi:hypothetical protein EYF80_007062 [Liparis tanakae]|uniref:Uncharacterized protein n=1 Tax=Liparis tanakae TaxID=230148 RepID=A0A4Z2IYE0_9TELE|nr:hypothetical protein EYF80_007062 [Liparis tanakae]
MTPSSSSSPPSRCMSASAAFQTTDDTDTEMGNRIGGFKKEAAAYLHVKAGGDAPPLFPSTGLFARLNEFPSGGRGTLVHDKVYRARDKLRHGVADVGPAADGALQHDRAALKGRGVDPPGRATTQVDVRLGFLLLADTVAVMASQHLPLSDLKTKISEALALVMAAGRPTGRARRAGLLVVALSALQGAVVTAAVRRVEVCVPQVVGQWTLWTGVQAAAEAIYQASVSCFLSGATPMSNCRPPIATMNALLHTSNSREMLTASLCREQRCQKILQSGSPSLVWPDDYQNWKFASVQLSLCLCHFLPPCLPSSPSSSSPPNWPCCILSTASHGPGDGWPAGVTRAVR